MKIVLQARKYKLRFHLKPFNSKIVRHTKNLCKKMKLKQSKYFSKISRAVQKKLSNHQFPLGRVCRLLIHEDFVQSFSHSSPIEEPLSDDVNPESFEEKIQDSKARRERKTWIKKTQIEESSSFTISIEFSL